MAKNRTLKIEPNEVEELSKLLLPIPDTILEDPPVGIICDNCLNVAKFLPSQFVDLLFLDPPYNLYKNFNNNKFSKRPVDEYTAWLNKIVVTLKPLLKETASIYICGDWLTSHSIYEVAKEHFVVRNRITWEREKGRGAKQNWKNASEDIWFCTLSNRFTFNVDAVKLKRKVKAPYRDENGQPKDWQEQNSEKYRLTHPSNLWTDLTIPFWSMPENTEHPTQKPEKLLAKLVLASTNPGDFVFDPFLGSGTTSVVAKKLDRKYLGIELDLDYCLMAAKRLSQAEVGSPIQGLVDGIFLDRGA